MKSIQIEAKTVEEAVDEALKQLNLPEERVDVQILSKGGLFSKAEVIVSEKETACARALAFVTDVIAKMGMRCTAEAVESADEINITVSGDDSGGVIGYRGETLDALQYLTLLVANQVGGDFKKVVINAEDYRAKREETLISLAGKLESKVERTGRKYRLEPMNPFERRVIHTALADSEVVRTESEGEEPNRRVVIIPKKPQRYNNNREGGYNNNREGGYNNRNRNNGGYGGYNNNRSNYRTDESNYGRMDADSDSADYTAPAPKEEESFAPRAPQPRKFKSFGTKKRF